MLAVSDYEQGLIEQIATDKLAIAEDAPPNQFFYYERIADYQNTLWELKMNEDDKNVDDMNQGEFEAHIDSNNHLDSKEKLFSKLFWHETKIVVRDMDRLTLRAHIEELAKISFEGKVRHHAAIAEDDRRGKAEKGDGPHGFERSVNTDESTTNAINTIKERQKKLTKQERIQASLEKLGISSTDAAKLMSAGTILSRLKDKGLAAPAIEPSEIKPVFNPFAKKVE